MKTFAVHLLFQCERDIADIHAYISTHDCVESADRVVDQLEDSCRALESLPEKGHLPPELERVGVTNYREIHFKPYRIIYEIVRENVFVHAVLGGRRDLQSFLERRILR